MNCLHYAKIPDFYEDSSISVANYRSSIASWCRPRPGLINGLESMQLNISVITRVACYLEVLMVVVVIIIGNGHSDPNSNPRWRCCISHCTNTPGKNMNPIILPLSMGK